MTSRRLARIARVVVLTLALTSGGLAAQRRASPLDGVAGVVATRDVDYVPGAEYDDARDRLDIFMPEGAAGVPVVVFFHGGELQFGNKSAGESLAARIVPEGIGVVSANYRLSPAFMHPAHIEDAATAVAWVIANIERYGGDPSNVYVSGYSAGGYLTALMGVDEAYLGAHGLARSAVRGWVTIAAFLYVEETAPTRDKSVWGTDPAAWLAASVTRHIGPGKDGFLLIYADGDEAWRREQNDRFGAALLGAGNRDVGIVEVPNRIHTTLVSGMTDPDDRIGPLTVEFVRRHSDTP